MTLPPAAVSLQGAEGLVATALAVGSVDRPSRAAAPIVAQEETPAPRSIVMMVHDRRIDRRVLDEARSLMSDGWSVTVLAGPADPTQPTPDEQVYPDVPIVRVTRGAAPTQIDPVRARAGIVHTVAALLALSPRVRRRRSPATRNRLSVADDLPQLGEAVIAARHHGGYVVYDSASSSSPSSELCSRRASRGSSSL